MSLINKIDVGQFLNYVNSYGFSNQELDLLGLNLTRSESAHDFCRNTAIMFSPDASEYLAEALANSQPTIRSKK